jgi:hypothetical protein
MRCRILVPICFLFAAPVAAQTTYDGNWDVTIQTVLGSCERTARYAVTIADGRISGPQEASGTVGRSGNVRVSIGSAYASGQLDGSSGSGKWNGASGGIPCSGRWAATRQ